MNYGEDSQVVFGCSLLEVIEVSGKVSTIGKQIFYFIDIGGAFKR